MSLLYLEAAKRHVAAFDREEMVVVGHYQAMDCLNCEAFLQLGIDAFDWLTKADVVTRKGVLDGVFPYDEGFDKVVENLFRSWLVPCKRANLWIAEVLKSCQVPANLERFRECESQVKSLVKFLEDDSMTDAIRELRDQAVAEHESGKTAEFV